METTTKCVHLSGPVTGLPRDGHRVNFLLIEQIGFGGIEELAGKE